MFSWILISLILIVFFIAFLLIRTLRLHQREKSVEPIEKIKLDNQLIARHLSDAIRCQTISNQETSEKDYSPWTKLHEVLKNNYPLLNRTLTKQEINHYSLLYKWAGRDNSLKPILFPAHLDVVPVDKDSEKQWTHPPFSGDIDKEFVWGRGALDMKNHLVTLLEAVEFLVKEGYSPKRTIYLAFGHDEEIYGTEGALKIAQGLEKQGIKLGAVLDEGGNITQEIFKDLDYPVAVVSTGEKGFLTLNVSAHGTPGHSSAPPRQTTISIVARALALIADNPMPARLETIEPLLQSIGAQLPISWQIMIANSWLFKNLLIKRLEKNTLLNAQIRTTSAATIISGGVKDNVIPAYSQAKVNFRLLPGDTVEKVMTKIKKDIADPRVELELEDGRGWNSSQPSPTDAPAFYTLALAIRQVFNNIPVVPSIFRGATDARHYEKICKNVYRFSPLLALPADAARVHGINERIRVEDLGHMVNFFIRIIRLWGEAEF
jgi:carboxypeptidase PM20D1